MLKIKKCIKEINQSTNNAKINFYHTNSYSNKLSCKKFKERKLFLHTNNDSSKIQDKINEGVRMEKYQEIEYASADCFREQWMRKKFDKFLLLNETFNCGKFNLIIFNL